MSNDSFTETTSQTWFSSLANAFKVIIGAAIALRSLEKGFIPPSIGYGTGCAPPPDIISGTSSLPLTSQNIQACNSGFGGINAGILCSRP